MVIAVEIGKERQVSQGCLSEPDAPFFSSPPGGSDFAKKQSGNAQPYMVLRLHLLPHLESSPRPSFRYYNLHTNAVSLILLDTHYCYSRSHLSGTYTAVALLTYDNGKPQYFDLSNGLDRD